MASVPLTFHLLNFSSIQGQQSLQLLENWKHFLALPFRHHTPTNFGRMTLPFLSPSVRSHCIWLPFCRFLFKLNIHLFLKMFRNTGPGYPKLCGLTHSQTIPEALPRTPLFFSLQIDSFLLDCVRIRIVYLARNTRKVPDWLSGCYWLTGRPFGKTVCIMFSASHCAQNWGKWSLEEEKKRIRLERDKAFLAGWVVQDVIQRSMYLREKLIKTNKESYSCFCRL